MPTNISGNISLNIGSTTSPDSVQELPSLANPLICGKLNRFYRLCCLLKHIIRHLLLSLIDSQYLFANMLGLGVISYFKMMLLLGFAQHKMKNTLVLKDTLLLINMALFRKLFVAGMSHPDQMSKLEIAQPGTRLSGIFV